VLKALKTPFPIEQHQLHIGGSIGVSLYPHDGEDPNNLLRAADTAMYDAKGRAGRALPLHPRDERGGDAPSGAGQ
jgi:GGDEF domain-containing protein